LPLGALGVRGKTRQAAYNVITTVYTLETGRHMF
jgi:hypothetical protein